MNSKNSSKDSRLKVAEELTVLFEQVHDDRRLALARLIEVRINEPQAFVTVIGETSSGKSTLINGLIGRPLLPVNAAPSTATVIQVVCRNESKDNFLGIYKDATQEEITQAEFNKLALKPAHDLLRLQLFTRPAYDTCLGLQVFDTPGYNSLLAGHEEVLRSFLPESDVVIFVVGHKTGFGQVDQDLMELMGNAVAHDPSIPIVLAINRAPGTYSPDDRRGSAILANVRDCLKREPVQIAIGSAPLEVSGNASARMPDTSNLWKTVADLVGTEAHQVAVNAKLTEILRALIADAISDLEREEFELSANDAERAQALIQVARLREALHLCRKAVRQTSTRLEKVLPEIVQSGCENLKSQIAASIDESNKWLGSDECAQWITVHQIPFGVRRICREVEFQVGIELDLLDKQLREIANTVVQKVRDDIKIQSDRAERFTENLVREVLERAGGAAIKDLLHGIGGVGGAAAGAGNLVKMGVSRAGSMVGKTFSREVYDAIGRTFTKKMMARLAIITSVLIDVGLYLNHVRRWQDELKKKALGSLDEWSKETVNEVLGQHVPNIEERNLRGVNENYEDLITEKKDSHQLASEESVEKTDALRARNHALASLMQRL